MLAFPVGTVVVDTVRNAMGTFQDQLGSKAHLRPLGGGREWEVDASKVREATPEECAIGQQRLLARVPLS